MRTLLFRYLCFLIVPVFFIVSCKKEPHTPTEEINSPYGSNIREIYFERVLEYNDDFQGTDSPGWDIWYSKHTFQVPDIDTIDASDLRVYYSVNNSEYYKFSQGPAEANYRIGTGTLSVSLPILGYLHISVHIKITAWK
jgi:hypothetical protein